MPKLTMKKRHTAQKDETSPVRIQSRRIYPKGWKPHVSPVKAQAPPPRVYPKAQPCRISYLMCRELAQSHLQPGGEVMENGRNGLWDALELIEKSLQKSYEMKESKRKSEETAAEEEKTQKSD